MTILCVLEKNIYIILSLDTEFYIFQLDLSDCVMQIFYFFTICPPGLSVTERCVSAITSRHTVASLLFLDQVKNPASSGQGTGFFCFLECSHQSLPLAFSFILFTLSYKETLPSSPSIPHTPLPHHFLSPYPHLFLFFLLSIYQELTY